MGTRAGGVGLPTGDQETEQLWFATVMLRAATPLSCLIGAEGPTARASGDRGEAGISYQLLPCQCVPSVCDALADVRVFGSLPQEQDLWGLGPRLYLVRQHNTH